LKCKEAIGRKVTKWIIRHDDKPFSCFYFIGAHDQEKPVLSHLQSLKHHSC
jgi:hypothetical protein